MLYAYIESMIHVGVFCTAETHRSLTVSDLLTGLDTRLPQDEAIVLLQHRDHIKASWWSADGIHLSQIAKQTYPGISAAISHGEVHALRRPLALHATPGSIVLMARRAPQALEDYDLYKVLAVTQSHYQVHYCEVTEPTRPKFREWTKRLPLEWPPWEEVPHGKSRRGPIGLIEQSSALPVSIQGHNGWFTLSLPPRDLTAAYQPNRVHLLHDTMFLP